MTPRQLRDAANGPWDEGDGFSLPDIEWLCPDCGNHLHDMRGKGFNIYQAAKAGMCSYLGNGDYTCSVKEMRRRTHRET